MSRKGKVFTLAEVAPHNNAKDCWVIIGGKVYDVTKFLGEHPGGPDALINVTGKDATEDFEAVQHSSDAKALLGGMCIGDIDASTLPKKTEYAGLKQQTYSSQNKTMHFINRIFQFILPFALLGAAVGVRFYNKSD